MSTLPLFDDDPPDRPAHKGAGGAATPSRSAQSADRGEGQGSGKRERIYRVAQVNRAARMLLEDRFNYIWIEGELSDVTRAASGHVYFTLNDEQEAAQLRGVMFRSDAARARAKLADGARVRLRGTVSLFEPRGSYQLVARIALPQGLGDLHARFEAVRRKLEQEGLLDPQRKRPLPRIPRVVGVVTSPAGAALHDIVRVSQARCPTRIVVSPCQVQGADAPATIVYALRAIAKLPDLSVVIVARGGGAAEDLFAFNDERVARAIAACPVPVVSAVGHEVDITIADLVADVRAATPSNAAELVVPEREGLLADLNHRTRALQRAMDMRMARARMQLDRAARDLTDPRAVLASKRRALEQRERTLVSLAQGHVARHRRGLAGLSERLSRLDPRVSLARNQTLLSQLNARLSAAMQRRARAHRSELSELAARLSAMSPLSVLARGYAIALHERTGKALLRATDTRPGDRLELRLHEGSLHATVDDDREEPT